jgi:hypothetical protein
LARPAAPFSLLDGRTQELLQAQAIHRKALAGLTPFRRAAEREEVTAEYARQILFYLRKARYNPDLKFEWQE